jgi:hypothetical protein
MFEELQSKLWLVLVVAIVSTAAVISVALIVIGGPFASRLADRFFSSQDGGAFLVQFEGSLDSVDGVQGNERGVSFVRGHTGKAAMFDDEDTLSYPADGYIHPQQGSIEFWLKPLWNGDDEQSYVFFEVGDSWFNRFRIIKDGANNFRFMAWSSQVEYDVACNVANWVANDWHKVRATWQGDSLSLYLDDALCDTQTFVVMPAHLSPRFYIGSSAQKDLQAQSAIDEFAIHTQP